MYLSRSTGLNPAAGAQWIRVTPRVSALTECRESGIRNAAERGRGKLCERGRGKLCERGRGKLCERGLKHIVIAVSGAK